MLGKILKPPAVLELRSDLGGGKTTFVRGLARGVGSKDTVTSPTFTLNNQYISSDGSTKISHFDFYRLREPGIMAGELAESINDAKTITVVEWGTIVGEVLPPRRLSIEFKPSMNNIDERQLTLTYPEDYSGFIKQLQGSWEKLRP